jgi:hypothetical protein
MTEKSGGSQKMIDAKEDHRNDENKNSKKAFEQAEEDIANDPETKLNEDKGLDEGELARKEGHP